MYNAYTQPKQLWNLSLKEKSYLRSVLYNICLASKQGVSQVKVSAYAFKFMWGFSVTQARCQGFSLDILEENVLGMRLSITSIINNIMMMLLKLPSSDFPLKFGRKCPGNKAVYN